MLFAELLRFSFCIISLILFISAAEGHSIFIRNLAYDATVEQLEEEFKKFGPIKSNGIQVRSSKVRYIIIL